jgi:hypothetical protein
VGPDCGTTWTDLLVGFFGRSLSRMIKPQVPAVSGIRRIYSGSGSRLPIRSQFARFSRHDRDSIQFKDPKRRKPIALATSPSSIRLPPRHSPATVRYHSIAAMVTRTTTLPTEHHASMKPTPVRMPSGNRIGSFVTKESGERPAVGSRRFTRIIIKEAARPRRPQPCCLAALLCCHCRRSSVSR